MVLPLGVDMWYNDEPTYNERYFRTLRRQTNNLLTEYEQTHTLSFLQANLQLKPWKHDICKCVFFCCHIEVCMFTYPNPHLYRFFHQMGCLYWACLPERSVAFQILWKSSIDRNRSLWVQIRYFAHFSSRTHQYMPFHCHSPRISLFF